MWLGWTSVDIRRSVDVAVKITQSSRRYLRQHVIFPPTAWTVQVCFLFSFGCGLRLLVCPLLFIWQQKDDILRKGSFGWSCPVSPILYLYRGSPFVDSNFTKGDLVTYTNSLPLGSCRGILTSIFRKTLDDDDSQKKKRLVTTYASIVVLLHHISRSYHTLFLFPGPLIVIIDTGSDLDFF